MYSEPCARFTMFMMPNTSVSPAAIRNSITPYCRPFSSCSKTRAKLTERAVPGRLPDAREHPQRERVEDEREDHPQRLHRQPVRDAGAERGEQHAGRGDEEEGRQVDIAEKI